MADRRSNRFTIKFLILVIFFGTLLTDGIGAQMKSKLQQETLKPGMSLHDLYVQRKRMSGGLHLPVEFFGEGKYQEPEPKPTLEIQLPISSSNPRFLQIDVDDAFSASPEDGDSESFVDDAKKVEDFEESGNQNSTAATGGEEAHSGGLKVQLKSLEDKISSLESKLDESQTESNHAIIDQIGQFILESVGESSGGDDGEVVGQQEKGVLDNRQAEEGEGEGKEEKSLSETNPDQMETEKEGTKPQSSFFEFADENDVNAQLAHLHDLDYHKSCHIRQGFLAYICRVKQKKGSTNTTTVWTRPAFVTITTQKFEVFSDERSDHSLASLLLADLSVPLELDSRIPDQICFQVKNKGKLVVELCAEDQDGAEEWIKAIQGFSECGSGGLQGPQSEQKDVQILEKACDNSALVTDNSNSSVGEIIDTTDSLSKAVIKRNFSEIKSRLMDIAALHNVDKEKKAEGERKLQRATEESDSNLNEIWKEMTEHINKADVKELNKREELIEVENKTHRELERVREQKAALEKALRSKELEEQNQAEMLIKEEKRREQKLILEQAMRKIDENKEKEVKELERVQQEVVNDDRAKIEQETSEMMDLVVERQKLTNPFECYQIPLAGAANIPLMALICQGLYLSGGSNTDVSAFNTCTLKENFCTSCCHGHIGEVHQVARSECQSQCGYIMNHSLETLAEENPDDLALTDYVKNFQNLEDSETQVEEG